MKELIQKNLKNSQKMFFLESLFNKDCRRAASGFIIKESPAHVFSCWEVFQSNFFEEHLWTTTSGCCIMFSYSYAQVPHTFTIMQLIAEFTLKFISDIRRSVKMQSIFAAKILTDLVLFLNAGFSFSFADLVTFTEEILNGKLRFSSGSIAAFFRFYFSQNISRRLFCVLRLSVIVVTCTLCSNIEFQLNTASKVFEKMVHKECYILDNVIFPRQARNIL